MTTYIPDRQLAERPSEYAGPNLSPVGLKLVPQLDPTLAAVLGPPQAQQAMLGLGRNLHRLTILATYRLYANL